MRFMMLLKSDQAAEAGVFPTPELLTAMGRYNDELVQAGALLAGEGLQASSKGARVRYAQGRHTVTDGPFPDPTELLAGFWLIQVESKQAAIEWARRCPFEATGPSATSGGNGEIELRQVFELENFPTRDDESGWREREAEFRTESRAPISATPKPDPDPAPRMRFIVLIKADRNTEAGVLPDEKLLTAMGELMAQTVKAGALVAGEGLQPSSMGARVRFSAGRASISEGPFSLSANLIAGYSIIDVRSKQEAIDWAQRCLEIHVEGTGIAAGEIEVRQLFTEADFPAELVDQVPEVFAPERQMRDSLAR